MTIAKEWIDHIADVLKHARKNAKVKGLTFDLSTTDAYLLFEQTQGRCQVTGAPFSFERFPHAHKRPFVPSLDRIDPRVGYSKGNCRWVLVVANVAMQDWGESVLSVFNSEGAMGRGTTALQPFVPRRLRATGLFIVHPIDPQLSLSLDASAGDFEAVARAMCLLDAKVNAAHAALIAALGAIR